MKLIFESYLLYLVTRIYKATTLYIYKVAKTLLLINGKILSRNNIYIQIGGTNFAVN